MRNLLYVDSHDVSFKANAAGKHEANLDLLVTISTASLDTPAPVSRRVEITADDDQLNKLLHEGILLEMNIPIKHAGPYQVRASVRDGNSAAIGSAGQFLEIPDLKKVHLALTTPILEDALATGRIDHPSTVLREFHTGANLSFVSLLETDRDEVAKLTAHDFDASIQLYSGDTQILNTPVPVAEVQGQSVHVLKAEVRLNNSLPAGQYYLKAIATDHHSKTNRSTSTWTDFQIVP